jgi:hypothetical protein
MMLLVPVLQHTRETSRRLECLNHLKELSIACVDYEATLHRFPSGGWPGPNLWIGDPDRGYGKSQPGGWTYNILQFIENKSLHDMGLGKTPAEKKNIFAQVAQTILQIYYCPSRRVPILCPVTQAKHWIPGNIGAISLSARTDYAANGRVESGIGVIYANSATTLKDIRDGLSHTYLLGEKALSPDHYKDGKSMGDNLPMYANSFCDWERSG